MPGFRVLEVEHIAGFLEKQSDCGGWRLGSDCYGDAARDEMFLPRQRRFEGELSACETPEN
ncbi:hypothetical protein Isop_0419 [Isosphaera pallida ATCC 43644]|jgi:hypothetical protein|uniref:Uncharacterized protein n=1 Tax=Isosphaera pallida (strain ATCC 43644 / DSM 9630 / IS1B) TaxID=575540 RepID=E8QYN8_ISOPI|nr:hypothetical protein Isop_0419 [Isosphaera pallida ATCC 43644]